MGSLTKKILFNIRTIGSRTTTHNWKYYLVLFTGSVAFFVY